MIKGPLSSVILLAVIIYVRADPCPNDCSARGRCDPTTRRCMCFAGAYGADCSLKSCPYGKAWTDQGAGVDNAHNLAECSNMGLCDHSSGLCACRTGYTGNACQRQSCPNSCNNRGRCLSMYYNAMYKDPGTVDASGNVIPVYAYDSVWDAHMIHGCVCGSAFNGTDCSLLNCPSGDDPLTGNPTQVDTPTNHHQTNDVQQLSCSASGGSFTLSFMGYTSQDIPFNTPFDTSTSPAGTMGLLDFLEAIPSIGVGGVDITPQTTGATKSVCSTTSVAKVQITFLQEFGPLPLLVKDATKLIGVTETSASVVVSKITSGTRENAVCSNRGLCDHTAGVCTCANNFYTSDGGFPTVGPGTRGDCGYPYTGTTIGITACPGAIQCNSHGSCDGAPTFTCSCEDGWMSADCSERSCPEGPAWFGYPQYTNVAHMEQYQVCTGGVGSATVKCALKQSSSVECSSAGNCNRQTGQCVCSSGYTGEACEVMDCYASCSGHGRCLDMAALVALQTVNGVNAGYTYGTDPTNPYTWDAHKVKGCLCDYPYTGYDCSQYRCPHGDDPVTKGQVDEVQEISCANALTVTGTVVFKFREYTTSTVSSQASVAQLQTALQLVYGVGIVSVSRATNSTHDYLCLPDGHPVQVTFRTTHGNLPLLQVASTTGIKASSIVITEVQAGTKEDITCSGRGNCDVDTGLCKCFSGFDSSDGMGNPGTLRDCGYIQPVTFFGG